jgi:hypothetical protein
LRTCLDETGTGGESPYAIVAGGISAPDQWDKLEVSWKRLMASRRVGHFHHTDFIGRQGDFGGWSNLKCDNFRKTMEKIIAKTVAFQVVVAVHRDTHADIKKRWRGVHGFKADSDYGLCFRVARFLICDVIARRVSPHARVSFLVESGPGTADAGVIYEGNLADPEREVSPGHAFENARRLCPCPEG